MQGRHTSINVQFSGTQECMIYFCGSNNFGDISKYFWHLPFWSPCIIVIYQGGPKQDLDQQHGLWKVSGGWVVGGCFSDYNFSSGPFETGIETSLRE